MEEQKRVYSPLDPPEKRPKQYAPLWVTVILFLLLILVSIIAFFTHVYASKQADELAIIKAELAQTQEELEMANSKVIGSRYIIGKAQECIDNYIDYFVGDDPGALTRLNIGLCEATLDQAMEDTCGFACDDLRDFANKFYSDNHHPQESDNNLPSPLTPSAVALPKNGEILFNNANPNKKTAPFTIETKNDGYYYVKLKDSISGEDVLGFFVYGGTEVNLEVPLGHYDLVYAYGHNWFGQSDIFGEETIYSKADETFLFYQDDGYVNGWTVELYLQTNGNLEVEEIPASEF